MSGGTISGNHNDAQNTNLVNVYGKDVFIYPANNTNIGYGLTISGTARIGRLCLNTNTCRINIGGVLSSSGAVATIDLYGASTSWTGNPIVLQRAAGVPGTVPLQGARFELGDFLTGTPTPVNPTYTGIDTDGRLQ
jgi:hypothetical protein